MQDGTVPTRLGPYEIIAPIGAGGMGQVFRARDERLGLVLVGRALGLRQQLADLVQQPLRHRAPRS